MTSRLKLPHGCIEIKHCTCYELLLAIIEANKKSDSYSKCEENQKLKVLCTMFFVQIVSINVKWFLPTDFCMGYKEFLCLSAA